MLFDALTTSKTRRALLRIFWGEGVSASIKEAAELSGSGFASTHRELRLLHNAGLVKRTAAGNAHVYSAGDDHPEAKSLRALLHAEDVLARAPSRKEVLESLASLGAPLDARPEPHHFSIERVLAAAVELSRFQGTVALVLPYVVHRHASTIRFSLLKHWARTLGVTTATGMFVDLAGDLGNNPRLRREARRFRDGRVSRQHDFFVSDTSPTARAVAKLNTPPLAKRWHFVMNMPLDSMRSVFDKQARAHALLS